MMEYDWIFLYLLIGFVILVLGIGLLSYIFSPKNYSDK